MNASLETLSHLFSITTIAAPLLIAWMAAQFALLYSVNRQRTQPLSNSALFARAAFGVGAGCLIGVSSIGSIWALVAFAGGALEGPGLLVLVLALPLGAVLGLVASHRLSQRWVARAAAPEAPGSAPAETNAPDSDR